MEKPTREEVVKYAKPLARKFIARFASDLPHEQKQEVEQNAYARVLKAYDGIEADRGWKSFVHNHCRGAVLDYLRFGEGYAEERWTIAKTEKTGSQNAGKIRDRITTYSAEDDEDGDFEAMLGKNGAVSPFGGSSPNDAEKTEVTIKWDLVSRMASTDPHLLVFAKWLRGFQFDELAFIFDLSKARIGQIIDDFGKRLDDGTLAKNPWVCQAVYAFGLCTKFGLPDVDQSQIFGLTSIGNNADPVDLDCRLPKPRSSAVQLGLFDEAKP